MMTSIPENDCLPHSFQVKVGVDGVYLGWMKRGKGDQHHARVTTRTLWAAPSSRSWIPTRSSPYLVLASRKRLSVVDTTKQQSQRVPRARLTEAPLRRWHSKTTIPRLIRRAGDGCGIGRRLHGAHCSLLLAPGANVARSNYGRRLPWFVRTCSRYLLR